jgi:zinc protease
MDVNTSDRLMVALRQVTAAQVQSVAQRYFSDEQLTTAVLVPDPSRRTAASGGAPAASRPTLSRH